MENRRISIPSFADEQLLSRRPANFLTPESGAFYSGKSVLITGGGGSIGSELCRQIAPLKPGRLIIADIYENGAYDVQQELCMRRDTAVEPFVEIASVCDHMAMRRIFEAHRPQIVIHAAAHKHVPLMEHNCCEAVRNNIFGTHTLLETAREYGTESFILISTDKAVNPVSVLGATKCMCEHMVLGSGQGMRTSAVRFGNVLGSAGSVIPLFRRQIQNGGPVTITDRRVIRYFMTVAEAAQLVLVSGAMARNGELYVLDMGEPVRILDIAEKMIRLSGYEPYSGIGIVETGLRPGEKLYEELLTASAAMERTENDMIFVARESGLSSPELDARLKLLAEAVETGDDEIVRAALRRTVPGYC